MLSWEAPLIVRKGMRKKAIYIFIVLFALLLPLGCGDGKQATRVWQTRDTVEAAAVDGFTVLGKATTPTVVEIGGGDYPYPGHPVSGARAAEVKRESAAMYATLAQDIAVGKVYKHVASDSQFGFTPGAARIIARIALSADLYGAHPTGLFLPAGELVTVTVPQSAVGAGLRIVVNYGYDDLTADTLTRMPRLQVEFALDAPTVKIAAPLAGTLDIVSDGVAADIELSGVVQAPYYRLGVDDGLSAGEGYAQLCLGNLNVVAPTDYIESDTLQAVCYFWRSAVETMGLTHLRQPLRMVFDDGAADRSCLRLPLTDAELFFDYERLAAGEGRAIFAGLAAQGAFGYIGKAAGARALLYRGMSRMTAAAFSRSPEQNSPFDAYSVLTDAVESDNVDAKKAAFLIGLDALANVDMRQLVDAADADTLVTAAARLAGMNLETYADIFGLPVSDATRATLRGYPDSFYPIANLFVGATPYAAESGVTLDFAAYTADPLGVYRLTKVKGSGLKKISTGVYAFTAKADEIPMTLTYKNTQTGESVTLEGVFARRSAFRFTPPVVAVDAIGKLPPVELDGVTVNAPYIVPVTHTGLSYVGDFAARTDGAYYGGRAAFGQVGAQVSYRFYGDTVAYYAYPAAGTAQITLDGKTVATADLTTADPAKPIYFAQGLKGKHTLALTCTAGEIDVAYFAVSYDPNLPPPFPRWLLLTLVFGGVTLGLVGILLLLFLLLFPLCNKYRGTDFPCRNFKPKTVKTQTHQKHTQAPDGGEVYDAYDDSWVPTVVLPPVVKDASKASVSPLRILEQPEVYEEEPELKTVAIPSNVKKMSTKTVAPKTSVTRSVKTTTLPPKRAAGRAPSKTVARRLNGSATVERKSPPAKPRGGRK